MNRLAGWIFASAFLVAAPLSAQSRDTIARDHRPPPGMCRIWLDDVPANRQPEPTDCPTAIRKRPPNGRVIFGEEVRRTRDAPAKLPEGVRQLRGKERERDSTKQREDPERKPESRSRVRRPPVMPPRP
jgi:hypothetical protein